MYSLGRLAVVEPRAPQQHEGNLQLRAALAGASPARVPFLACMHNEAKHVWQLRPCAVVSGQMHANRQPHGMGCRCMRPRSMREDSTLGFSDPSAIAMPEVSVVELASQGVASVSCLGGGHVFKSCSEPRVRHAQISSVWHPMDPALFGKRPRTHRSESLGLGGAHSWHLAASVSLDNCSE